jgi:RHS repeat-associated protein
MDMPLAFERVFAQTISRRFEHGPLGRGWRHNWQYSLTKDDDNTVVVTDPSGTPRIFQPDSRYSSRYLAQPGDYGVLRTSGGNLVLTESDGLKLTFSEGGRLLSMADTNGNSITCEYSGDLLTKLIHSSGPSLTLTYDGNGKITAIADHLNRETRYTYSGEYLASCETYDGLTTTYAYNATPGSLGLHGLAKIQLPDGTSHFFEYNSQGWLKSAYGDNNSERLDFAYADGGQVHVTDPMNHTNRYYFDNWGRLVRGENPLGEVTRMVFDEIGNLVEKIDPNGVSRKFSYDRKGNLIEALDASHHFRRLTYTRTLNRMASARDAGDRNLEFTHDSRGNLTDVVYGDGSRETLTYDQRGNPIEWTNRRDNVIRYSYDEQGRLTGKTYSDDSQTIYTYDSHGNLLSATDVQGEVTEFTWDENDYLIRVDYPEGRFFIFTYDAAGRRVSSEDQLGYRVTWRYDALGRLEAVSDGAGDLVEYGYDDLGRLIRKTCRNGMYSLYSYDAAGRLLRLANHRTNGGILSFFEYSYDRLGRRVGMNTHYGDWTYTYDNLGQLTDAELVSSHPDIQDQTLSFSYDLSGNRVEVVKNGERITYSANTVNQYVTADGKTMTYDADGNLVEEIGPDGIVNYEYDDENRLIGVTKGVDVWEYGYDALGNRVRVTFNGNTAHYVFDPFAMGNVVGEYAENGQWLARYTHGLGLVGKAAPGDGDVFYAFDPMGNASELTGADEAVKNMYAYMPFGDALLRRENIVNSFQFAGEMGVMAEGNGLHLMRARYYDSRDGRFTSMDPVGLAGGDMNLYRYAANNPVHRADPTGLSCNKKARPRSAKRRFVETYTQYHDHINMRNVKKHPSGLIDENAYGDKYFGLREKAYRQRQEMAVEIVNDDVIVDSWWSWIPGYEWFSGANNLADVVGGINDARNPGTSCRWNRKPTKAPKPPARGGARGASYSAGSQDPNEKQAIAGYGAPNYLADGTQVAYRVDFENTESASAPAQFVTVRDTLSDHLDLATLELLEAGFGDVVIPIPPGLQYFDKIVDYNYTDGDYDFSIQVRVEIGLEDGILWANFTSLDPENAAFELPPPVDVGFLMPENETGRGQGYVSFAVAPKPGLPSNTAVRNVATIQFDGSLLIDTNQVDPMDPSQGTDPEKEALVTFDTVRPTSTMVPLPEEVEPSFSVSWSGQDEDSGIAGYDVYVRENGGEWKLWLSGATGSSALFQGKRGSLYEFYSVAIDNAGNREEKAPGAEIQTVVADAAPGDINGDGKVDIADLVLALQICSGVEINTFVDVDADVNGDNRIGMVEASYILQELSKGEAQEEGFLRSPASYETDPIYGESDMEAMISGFSEFTLDFYHALGSTPSKQGKNLFFSAYSIENALTMTWAGARGQTEEQMAGTLHLELPQERFHPTLNALNIDLNSRDDQPPPSGDPFSLNVVNALWSRIGYPFLPSYLEVIATNYDAGVRVLDFVNNWEESRETINLWVEDQTNEKIKDLLPQGSITPDTAVVLTNAIYFKGSWYQEFDEDLTAEGPFFRLDGTTVTPDMMHGRLDTRYAEGIGFDAVELPYASPMFEEYQYPQELSMLLIVPEKGQFETVEGMLNKDQIDAVVSSLGHETVDLTFPKFEFECEIGCKTLLQSLGMADAFEPAAADFGNMVDPELSRPWIDEVYHKAFVAVDEEGTEAAAATAVVMTETSVPEVITVSADKPFIFLIRDQVTGSILFMGRVLDPTL